MARKAMIEKSKRKPKFAVRQHNRCQRCGRSLLSKDFIKLVLIAFLVAIPFSYYFLNKWLDRFAYQVDMNWWQTFIWAGIGTVLLTFLTISFKSIKAALHNPAESLRTE
jgi:putative ABC transport system permease protein